MNNIGKLMGFMQACFDGSKQIPVITIARTGMITIAFDATQITFDSVCEKLDNMGIKKYILKREAEAFFVTIKKD